MSRSSSCVRGSVVGADDLDLRPIRGAGREAPRPCRSGGRRRRGSRRRLDRARTGARRAWPRPPRGSTSSGRAARAGTGAGTTASFASSHVHVGPPNGERQLFGGPPPRPSRQMYQSRLGESRAERESRNQGCCELVWFGTQSSNTFRPSRCASATIRSKAARSPKTGSTSRVVAHVVAEIRHRRRVDRREPDGVDTQPCDVREPREDPAEVADAVAVGVEERPRVDLVDHGRAPPAGAVPHVVRHAAEASGPPLGRRTPAGAGRHPRPFRRGGAPARWRVAPPEAAARGLHRRESPRWTTGTSRSSPPWCSRMRGCPGASSGRWSRRRSCSSPPGSSWGASCSGGSTSGSEVTRCVRSPRRR